MQSKFTRLHVRIYWLAAAFAVLFTFAHIISLPVEITYDGLGYIDLSDVLGSSRFPQEWYSNRTPLFPLALKVGFWLFGKQPLAAIAVSSVAALAGILTLGTIIRRVSGDLPAAVSLVLVTMFPTLVAYQHAVLTETGTFFFLMSVVGLALLHPETQNGLWARAAALIAVCAVGYYWRQNVLPMAPVVGLLLGLREWWERRTAKVRQLAPAIARVLLVLFLPFLLTRFWGEHIDMKGLRDTTLRQGMIRQALLPPEDPYVGANGPLYMQAIRESIHGGNFYSGVTWDRLTAISPTIFEKPLPGGAPDFFLSMIHRYPDRYFSGFGRTMLFFSGVSGVESDNKSFREEVLSLGVNGSKVGDGPQPLQSRIKEQFRQVTTPSVVMRLLRLISPFYDGILIWAALATLIGMVGAVAIRRFDLFLFCTLPIAYMLSFAVLLVSIDRFMVPIYPMMVANLVLVPSLFWSALREKKQKVRTPERG